MVLKVVAKGLVELEIHRMLQGRESIVDVVVGGFGRNWRQVARILLIRVEMIVFHPYCVMKMRSARWFIEHDDVRSRVQVFHLVPNVGLVFKSDDTFVQNFVSEAESLHQVNVKSRIRHEVDFIVECWRYAFEELVLKRKSWTWLKFHNQSMFDLPLVWFGRSVRHRSEDAMVRSTLPRICKWQWTAAGTAQRTYCGPNSSVSLLEFWSQIFYK